MKILTDIGGTFIRFARLESGKAIDVVKYNVTDYESFEAALSDYNDSKSEAELLIASAGYIDDAGEMRFVNNNKWVISPEIIAGASIVLNDFEAVSWALVSPSEDFAERLREGSGGGGSKCIIGPGTGLGIGYAHGSKVQKTHGGHMPATSVSEEQQSILAHIGGLVVFEDLVSGSGLVTIYRAVCALGGKDAPLATPKDLITYKDKSEVQSTLRLFHEFFGLCAASAVIFGNSYGGLYLTGGVIERLREHDLFDFAAFEGSFLLQGADRVRDDLAATPIYRITEPYPALHGLIVKDQVSMGASHA